MWVVVVAVVVVVVLATYVTWISARVDRLHARAAAAHATLDAQSVRRAAAAAELGEQEGLPEVQQTAKAVLAAEGAERQAAENDLTRQLRLAVAGLPAQRFANVTDASRRLALTRQVHSDLVRDAQAIRRRPLVRLLRLARKHRAPAFFDIDEPAL